MTIFVCIFDDGQHESIEHTKQKANHKVTLASMSLLLEYWPPTIHGTTVNTCSAAMGAQNNVVTKLKIEIEKVTGRKCVVSGMLRQQK